MQNWFVNPVDLFFFMREKDKNKKCKLTISGCGQPHKLPCGQALYMVTS